MDLLIAAKSGSLKDVEDAVKSQGIWTDYDALNSALATGNVNIAKFLISQNFRVNRDTSSEFESSPLHKAVELKDIGLVKLLLDKKASVSVITKGKNTPLHLAFLLDLTEIVSLLLQYINETSVLENCKNDIGLSHLHIACTMENSTVIEKYLEANANIEDAVNNDSPKWAGYTAYHFAAEYKSTPAIYTLANSELQEQSMQKDKSCQTARDLACARLVEYTTMTHIMSGLGGNRSYYFQNQSDMPKCEVVDQPTAFHFACMTDDSDLVKAFLDHGAPVNIPVSKKIEICPLSSPLHIAVESGRKKTVELLLKNGADVSAVNGYNMTALHLAMYTEEGGMPNDMTNLLYSKVENKKANLKDANGLSYFHVACSKNDLELVKKMLNDKQVDVNSQVLANNRGFSLYTPFHFAVLYGRQEMIKLLANHGANVNAVCSEGTAVQLVFEEQDLEYMHDLLKLLVSVGCKADTVVGKKTILHKIVHKVIDNSAENRDPTNVIQCDSKKELDLIGRVIELGCDVNAKDEDGNTALNYASTHSFACVRRLLQAGADVNVENNKGQCVGLFHGNSMSRRPEDTLVCHHVQNLKALGLKINLKLDKECDELLKCWHKTAKLDKECDELLECWQKTTKHSEDDTDYGRNSWPWRYDRSPTKTFIEDYGYGEDMFEVRDRDSWLHLTQVVRPGEIKEMKKVKLDKKTTLFDFMRLEDEDVGVYTNNKVLKSVVEGLVGNNQGFLVYAYLIKLQYRKSQKYAEVKVKRKRSSVGNGSKEDVSKRKRVA